MAVAGMRLQRSGVEFMGGGGSGGELDAGDGCWLILAARIGWSLPRGVVLAPVAMATHQHVRGTYLQVISVSWR